MRWVVVGGVGAQRIRPPPVLSGENLTPAMCLKSIVIHLLAQGKRVSRFFLQILLKSWKVNSTASTLNILLSYLLYIIAKEKLQWINCIRVWKLGIQFQGSGARVKIGNGSSQEESETYVVLVTHFGCHFKPSLHWQYSPGDIDNLLNGVLGGSENITLYDERQCGFTVWPNFHPGPASVTVRAVWSPKVGTGWWKSRHTEMPPAQDPLSWVGALPEDRCNIFTCCFDLWRLPDVGGTVEIPLWGRTQPPTQPPSFNKCLNMN